jgi:hypothetical protein
MLLPYPQEVARRRPRPPSRCQKTHLARRRPRPRRPSRSQKAHRARRRPRQSHKAHLEPTVTEDLKKNEFPL